MVYIYSVSSYVTLQPRSLIYIPKQLFLRLHFERHVTVRHVAHILVMSSGG